MSSLKTKTLQGMGWSAVENVAGTGTTFLVGLVLARLLTPTEFGVIGVITVFVAVVQLFVDSGFSQALIRKLEVSKEDYNTVFYFGIAVALIGVVGVYFGAQYVAFFFDNPIIEPLMQVVGVTLIVNAFGVVQKVVLTRELDFKTQAIITICAAVISGIIGIVMALNGYGVWSLIYQIVTRSVVQTSLLWVWCRWRPALMWSKESFSQMFNFGYKLLISGLIDTLYKNVYYIIIGKVYSTKTLGEYTRANQFSNIISANLLGVVQKVSFPVLSSMQNNDQRLLDSYRKMIKTTMLISFALLLGLAATAEPLIRVLIGEQWMQAIPYMQILCVSEMLFPLHAINLNILQIKGRSDLFLKLEIIKKVIALPVLLAGIYWGIYWLLGLGVVISFISYLINASYSGRLISYSTGAQIRDIFPTFVVSAIVAVVMWCVTLLEMADVATLVVQIAVGVGLAITIYEKLRLKEYLEIKSIVIKVIKNVIKR